MVAKETLSVIGGCTLVGVRLLQSFFQRQDARRAERAGYLDPGTQDAAAASSESAALGRRAVVVTVAVIAAVQVVDWARSQLRRRKRGKSLQAASDLAQQPREIVVITTACIPWMTGTSINPIMRVLYLALRGHRVTLLAPFVEPLQQKDVFAQDKHFASSLDQEAEVRGWINKHAKGLLTDAEGRPQAVPAFRIAFYPSVYVPEFGSLFPVGDVLDSLPSSQVRDFCIMEEPEHLTWYHTGKYFTDEFKFVAGIVHTNYSAYAKEYGIAGPVRALALKLINKWVCKVHCHIVVKLSDAIHALPHAVTCNVHGVRSNFLQIGKGMSPENFTKGAYFLGKALWSKGYKELLGLMHKHQSRTGEQLVIDMYGSGPDVDAIREHVESRPEVFGKSYFHGAVLDHADPSLHSYRVFVNPSSSDVVCTATAEALAMGKQVVLLDHPSNRFFQQFTNCRLFKSAQDFSDAVLEALSVTPAPLTDTERYMLSWIAATDRLYEAVRPYPGRDEMSSTDILMGSLYHQLVQVAPKPSGVGSRASVSEADESDDAISSAAAIPTDVLTPSQKTEILPAAQRPLEAVSEDMPAVVESGETPALRQTVEARRETEKRSEDAPEEGESQESLDSGITENTPPESDVASAGEHYPVSLHEMADQVKQEENALEDKDVSGSGPVGAASSDPLRDDSQKFKENKVNFGLSGDDDTIVADDAVPKVVEQVVKLEKRASQLQEAKAATPQKKGKKKKHATASK
ncbi:Digalactosyldiacylglycerol synthase 2, chloroplastic [Porphyridium purpureum]|uniref:Digalactosyldiacylglycerol synthase 2, chloroplastic n=1 Tax=Porphyridium purpureum TaxID=35688 RepID=A0A5J4YVY7_PORPP|nr:Digalactosyldiacylglycerol synthase 2, chloroplastic [Porphyridium purpureum]|eukprot:POR8498..scf209_3